MKAILEEMQRMEEEVQQCVCGKKHVQIGFATMGTCLLFPAAFRL